MLPQMNRVCKDCKPPKRHLGCHSEECPEYIEERDKIEALRKEINRKKHEEDVYKNYIKDSVIKNERARRNKKRG